MRNLIRKEEKGGQGKKGETGAGLLTEFKLEKEGYMYRIVNKV